MAEATLYYVHDPMCSWCWGYKPEWTKLQASLPDNLKVQYVVGGLAADTDEPMPTKMQQTISSYWRRIESELGTQFNHDFWTLCQPRRSTYPACRAVLAAKWQGYEQDMITAIQKAYYLNAKNPSDVSTLVQLAQDIGLDDAQFQKDLSSQTLEEALQSDIQLSRQLPIRGFPSLVLEVQEQMWPIPVDYKNHLTALDEVSRLLLLI